MMWSVFHTGPSGTISFGILPVAVGASISHVVELRALMQEIDDLRIEKVHNLEQTNVSRY